MSHSQANSFTNRASAIIGSTLAIVSIYCSAVFWSSFASTLSDQIIAATIAAALVACQYLFFIVRKNHTGKIKHAHTAAVFILFITSAAATIAWLESRYQSTNKTELKSDVIYNQKITHLAELNKKLATLNNNAATDTALDFRARAKSTLRQAEQTEYKIEKLTRELSQFKSISNNAGSTLANNLNTMRWFLWVLLAALVDICPMICFSNTTKNNIATIQNDQTVAPQPAPTLKTNEPAIYEELALTIADEISSNQYGDKPSVRAVMMQHNIRHDRAKTIFEQLAHMNIVKRDGQRFTRIKNPLNAQEQSA